MRTEKIVIKRNVWHCEKTAEGGCNGCKKLKDHPKFVFLLYARKECGMPGKWHPHYFVSAKDSFNTALCDSNIEIRFKSEKEAKEYAEKNKLKYADKIL